MSLCFRGRDLSGGSGFVYRTVPSDCRCCAKAQWAKVWPFLKRTAMGVNFFFFLFFFLTRKMCRGTAFPILHMTKWRRGFGFLFHCPTHITRLKAEKIRVAVPILCKNRAGFLSAVGTHVAQKRIGFSSINGKRCCCAKHSYGYIYSLWRNMRFCFCDECWARLVECVFC